MNKLFLYLCSVWVGICSAQTKKDFTLEDVFVKNTFRMAVAPGFNAMNDGEHYTEMKYTPKGWYLIKKAMKTGDSVSVISSSEVSGLLIAPASYSFSDDESLLILTDGTESIYRHSSKANAYVVNIAGGKTLKLEGGKVMYPTISPDNKHLAYVRDNNMYITEISSGKESAITSDGKRNEIINGAVDWVYEEEFSMSRGFEWSPDGKYIAFYRFDESKVKEFSMDIFAGLYPGQEKWKYPKAGEDNSKVDVVIYSIGAAKSTVCKTGSENDQYLPRIGWTNSPALLSIQRLNRLQNKWELLLAAAETGDVWPILTENSNTYVDINDNLKFIKGQNAFIYTTEKDGFNHIYLRNFSVETDKKEISAEKQLTLGNWDVTGIAYVDEKNEIIYYTSSEISPTEDRLYCINFKGKKKMLLTPEQGHHSITFGKGGKYYTDMFSAMGVPLRFTLKQADGKWQRVLESNRACAETMGGYNFGKTEFGQMTTDSGIKLNYWMIKPAQFDPSKKYPVLMFVYGGPGHNTVRNNWGGRNYLYHQYLSQKGYIVVSVDGRGTGNRGEQFKKCTYLQLGKLEHQDQAAAARWLAQQSYVDGKRIGIWGWSFGGYMSSLCITKTPETFKMAIAVAPVTNWRYYDNIYTERFLRTPKENPSGYDDNSPINFVKNIRGSYLLVHGTGDDNVHWQNTAEMINSMIKAGVRYDSELYPNRNHGIGDRAASYHLYRRMTEFVMGNL